MRTQWLGCLLLVITNWQATIAADAIELTEPESDARVHTAAPTIRRTPTRRCSALP